MKKTVSLTVKFIVALLIILFLGQGLGSILVILSVRGNMVDSLKEKMERTADILGGIAAKPVLDSNSTLLNANLEKFFKDEDLINLAVFDKNKNLLGEKKRFAQKPSKINPFFVQPFFKDKKSVFSGDEKIGEIVITVSSKRINDEMSRHMVLAVACQILLSVVVVLFISGFFSRNIKKPLSELNFALSKADSGDLTAAMQPANNPEFAVIAKNLNSLFEKFQTAFKKLYSNADNVITTVTKTKSFIVHVSEGAHNQTRLNEEIISKIEGSNKLQKEFLDSTFNLAEFSAENLSSVENLKSKSEKINKSTKDLSQSSADSFSTIAEISASVKEIAKNTEELSLSTEETSAAVHQIGANIKEVDNSAKESANLAYKVREIAAEWGMLTVADAMGGMDEIAESVDKTLELINNLTKKSRDIEKILAVISDVTKQTNLLSVNAAILAAQAGEYGKGFLVVADEIKALADRTIASTKEITDIIKSIQDGIAEVTFVSGSTKSVVTNGNALVVKTGEAFREVINSAQKSTAMADKIQKATEEQVQGIMQIKESMEMIMSTVEHVTRSVREQKIGSEHLLSVVDQTKEVSEVIDRNIEEQSSEILSISQNLSLTNEKINELNNTVKKYTKSNETLLLEADKATKLCKNVFTVAQEISASFDALCREAESIKKDLGEFKFE